MSESIFTKWKNGLEKTRKVAFGRIANFLGTSELDDETWEDLEALLILADMGIETTMSVIQSVRDKVQPVGLMASNSISKISVAFGPMSSPAPASPYASSDGIKKR